MSASDKHKGKNMKQKILAVMDTKSESFLNPITVKTIGEAERGFGDEVNNPQSMMYKHPEDFGLYLIGEYDAFTGLIKAESQPKHIASAINLKRPSGLAPQQVQ
nr:MAG: nonstructural protein [Microvirus sp.]